MAQGQGIAMDRPTFLSIEGGSLIEGLTGVGGGVLAIIGMAGIYPQLMLSVAVITVAAGLLLQGMAVAARFSAILSETENSPSEAQVRGGVSAETLGGIAGVALGILSLIGLVPMTLTSVAVIVFGVAIILASRVNFRLNTTDIFYSNDRARNLASQAVTASSDLQMVIGLAAITLGILALVHIAALTMALIGILCVGIADFLSGASIAGKMFLASRH